MMKLIKKYESHSFLLLVLTVCLTFLGCEKKYELDLSLSVTSTEIHLTPTEGQTNIMVYADGGWTVAIKEETDWLTLGKKSGEGNADILFSYNQNFGVTRKATLVISKGGESKEVLIIQTGQNASFRFAKSKFTVTKNPFHVKLPIINDLKANINRIKIEYLYDDETSEKWITNANLTAEGLEFDLLENMYGRNRTVRIYLTVYDALEKEYTVYTDVDQSTSNPILVPKTAESYITKRPKLDTVIVKGNVGALFSEFKTTVSYEQGNAWIENVELQNDSLLIIAVRGNDSGAERRALVNLQLVNNGVKYIDFTHKVIQTANDYDLINIESLKGMITATTGSIRITAPLKVLEAIVVGDAKNNNMEDNPNLLFNSINFTESPKTNYIQNANGTSGIRLKFGTEAANIISRYSKIGLMIHGLKLIKEANPTRYTIEGVVSSNIVSQENTSPSDYSIQSKYISEITDADVHTYVKLKETAVSVPYGSFTNVNMGYVRTSAWNTAGAGTNVAYVDAVPTSIYDAKGGSIKMIVNTANSWSRNTLPTGVGELSGIVVYNTLKKYGPGEGNIGRYSIRPVTHSDVDMYKLTTPTTVVEWRMFNPSNLSVGGTLTANAGGYAAAIGTGRVSATSATTATLGAHPVHHTEVTSKVVPSSAFQFNQRWWNHLTNAPEAMILRFSTTGVNTISPLILNFSVGGGSGSTSTLNVPLNWNVLYSTDGVNYTIVPNSNFYVRPLAGWGLDHDFTANGLNPYAIKLPESLLGKSDVYLKIQPKDNVCGENTSSGGDSGRITASGNNSLVTVRFGAVSINYIP